MGVGEVRDCLCGSTEVLSRVDPAHNHWFSAGLGRGEDAELGDVSRIDANAVDSVGDINFDKVYRAKAGISVKNTLEDTGQRSAEVNACGGSKADRLGVDLGKCLFYDRPGSTVALRDNA
jgi:hypothetical protein